MIRYPVSAGLMVVAFLCALSAVPASAQSDPLASVRPHHVALSVSNFEASAKWYEEKLGFRRLNVREYPGLGARGVFLERNGFLIELFNRAGSRRSAPAPEAVPDDLLHQGYKHIGFSVDNVDAAIAILRSRGVMVVGEPTDVPELGLRLAFIKDNEGNLIELGHTLGTSIAR